MRTYKSRREGRPRLDLLKLFDSRCWFATSEITRVGLCMRSAASQPKSFNVYTPVLVRNTSPTRHRCGGSPLILSYFRLVPGVTSEAYFRNTHSSHILLPSFSTHPSISFHANQLAIHASRTYLPMVFNLSFRVVSTGIVPDTPTCSLRGRVTAIDSLLQPSTDRGCGAITVSASCSPVSFIYK